MPIAPPPQLKSSLFARTPGAATPRDAKAPPKAAGPRGFRIEHRVGVQAPAEVIWDVIADLEHWNEWNPTYPRASGAIRIGAPLSFTLALPGQAERAIEGTVLDWVPNEQLHWRVSMMGGLIKTVRYIEIEQLAEASCIVSHGEIFGGLMGPTAAKQIGRAVHRGFVAMSEGLKARAEAGWQARQG